MHGNIAPRMGGNRLTLRSVVRKPLLWGSVIMTVSIAIFSPTAPTLAAQQVVFHYGLFEYSLSIEDLEHYANTGQASRQLARLLRRVDPNPTLLRSVLNQSFAPRASQQASLIELDRLLTTGQGELILKRFGDVIQPESRRQNGYLAIRSAILLAASRSEKPTLLNAMRQFPGRRIMVDVRRLPSLVNTLQRLNRISPIPMLDRWLSGLPQPSLPQAEVDLRLENALIAWMNGNVESILPQLNALLALRQEMGDRKGEAVAHLAIGLYHDTFGYTNEDFDLAIAATQTALEIFQKNNLKAGEGLAFSVMAYAYLAKHDYGRALNFYQQSLATYDAVPDNARFTTAELLEPFFPADNAPFQTYRLVELIHQHLGKPVTLSQMGQVYRQLDQYEQALEYFEESLAHYRRLGFRSQEAVVLHGMGKVYHRMGQYDQALSYLRRAKALEQNVDFPARGEGNINWTIAEVQSAQGNYESALAFFKPFLRYNNSDAFYSVANIYKALGNIDQAYDFYQQALTLYRRQNNPTKTAQTLSRLGNLLSTKGQANAAIDYYQQAVEQYEAMRQVNATLPPDLQQAYTDSIADTYRNLAEQLRQQNRTREAQQVMDLLDRIPSANSPS